MISPESTAIGVRDDNKFQVQTITTCDLDLENPCFSHDELYVVCSRIGGLYVSER